MTDSTTDAQQPLYDRDAARRGQLLARPCSPQTPPLATMPPVTPGVHALGIAGADGRDCLLYVPAGYDPTRPAPLVVLLHGAGGSARSGLYLLLDQADAAGLLLFAPSARMQTWDVIMGAYGPDVIFIDRGLAQVFARCSVETTRLAIGGFSDGASYALSLGLSNGDLFNHIIAFSPGFMAPRTRRGKPRVYVSHGVYDTVLPIERCGRRIVHALRRDGYDVDYHEFDGPHTVPPEIAQEAANWLAQ